MNKKDFFWDDSLDNVQNFIKYLLNNKFSVEKLTIFETSYFYYEVKGFGIRGFFTDNLKGTKVSFNLNVDNRLVIDNNECFDKITKCPFSYDLPQNLKECEFLGDQFKWISSKDGHNYCRSTFESEFIKYPRRLRKVK